MTCTFILINSGLIWARTVDLRLWVVLRWLMSGKLYRLQINKLLSNFAIKVRTSGNALYEDSELYCFEWWLVENSAISQRWGYRPKKLSLNTWFLENTTCIMSRLISSLNDCLKKKFRRKTKQTGKVLKKLSCGNFSDLHFRSI